MWFLSGLKGDLLFRILMPNTLNVSNKGIIKMANPIAGADCMLKTLPVEFAVLMNFITRIEFTNPTKREPVSPMNIFAGGKL